MSEHTYRKGTALARHSHAQLNLTIVVSGEYVEQVCGKSELCRAGSVRFLPAGETHESKFQHDSRCLVVEVDSTLHAICRGSASFMQAGEIHSSALRLMGQRLQAELRAADESAPMAIEGVLLGVLAEVQRSRRNSSDAPFWLPSVLEMLQEKFADSLSVAEIARVAGVHPVYLCRQFKRCERVTVAEFIRQLRVRRACDLLLNSNMPLAEIALACGFADQSHFSVVFKRVMGTTPSGFRTNYIGRCAVLSAIPPKQSMPRSF